MKKCCPLLILLITSFTFASFNSFGNKGLNNIPSAYIDEEGTVAFSLKDDTSFRRFNLIAVPYPWLEVSIFYADIPSKPYKAAADYGIIQSKKDKGFNVKFRLYKETDSIPEISIGLSDFAGTGIFSGEYIVASKKIDNTSLHLGMGWGIYNSAFSFENPFKAFNSNFDSRNFDEGNTVGKIDPKDWFSGDEASLFFGIERKFKNHSIYLESDPINFTKERFGVSNNSKYNFGYRFHGWNFITPSINLDDNGRVNFNLSLQNNFSKTTKKYQDFQTSGNKAVDLIVAMQVNDIGLTELAEGDNNELILGIRQNSYNSTQEVHSNILQIIDKVGINGYDEVVVNSFSQGMLVRSEVISGDNARMTKIPIASKTLYQESEDYPYVSYGFAPEIKSLIASRESFYEYGLFGQFNFDVYLNRNTFVRGKLVKSIVSNFDNLFIPPTDTYPEQVRSDIKDYLKNVGKDLSIEHLEISHLIKKDNHHFALRAGLFESMFGGYGFEYLFLDQFSDQAFGIEIFDVRKRDYDYDFNFLDYRKVTGHINYFKYFDSLSLTAHLSWGQYLAGDEGATFDFSRRFKNGMSMGAYFTLTDVSFEEFGEGSFDKGIYISVPISSFFTNTPNSTIRWSPLTKDPGQKLALNYRLFGFLQRYIY